MQKSIYQSLLSPLCWCLCSTSNRPFQLFYLATNFSAVWCTAGQVDPRSHAYCWPCSSEMGPLVRSDAPQDPMAMTLRAVDTSADGDAAATRHMAVLVRRTAVFHVEVAPWRTLGAAWGGRLSWVILPIRAQLHLGVWQEHMQQRPLWGGSRCCGCTHSLFPATVATLFTLSVQAWGTWGGRRDELSPTPGC